MSQKWLFVLIVLSPITLNATTTCSPVGGDVGCQFNLYQVIDAQNWMANEIATRTPSAGMIALSVGLPVVIDVVQAALFAIPGPWSLAMTAALTGGFTMAQIFNVNILPNFFGSSPNNTLSGLSLTNPLISVYTQLYPNSPVVPSNASDSFNNLYNTIALGCSGSFDCFFSIMYYFLAMGQIEDFLQNYPPTQSTLSQTAIASLLGKTNAINCTKLKTIPGQVLSSLYCRFFNPQSPCYSACNQNFSLTNCNSSLVCESAETCEYGNVNKGNSPGISDCEQQQITCTTNCLNNNKSTFTKALNCLNCVYQSQLTDFAQANILPAVPAPPTPVLNCDSQTAAVQLANNTTYYTGLFDLITTLQNGCQFADSCSNVQSCATWTTTHQNLVAQLEAKTIAMLGSTASPWQLINELVFGFSSGVQEITPCPACVGQSICTSISSGSTQPPPESLCPALIFSSRLGCLLCQFSQAAAVYNNAFQQTSGQISQAPATVAAEETLLNINAFGNLYGIPPLTIPTSLAQITPLQQDLINAYNADGASFKQLGIIVMQYVWATSPQDYSGFWQIMDNYLKSPAPTCSPNSAPLTCCLSGDDPIQCSILKAQLDVMNVQFKMNGVTDAIADQLVVWNTSPSIVNASSAPTNVCPAACASYGGWAGGNNATATNNNWCCTNPSAFPQGGTNANYEISATPNTCSPLTSSDHPCVCHCQPATYTDITAIPEVTYTRAAPTCDPTYTTGTTPKQVNTSPQGVVLNGYSWYPPCTQLSTIVQNGITYTQNQPNCTSDEESEPVILGDYEWYGPCATISQASSSSSSANTTSKFRFNLTETTAWPSKKKLSQEHTIICELGTDNKNKKVCLVTTHAACAKISPHTKAYAANPGCTYEAKESASGKYSIKSTGAIYEIS